MKNLNKIKGFMLLFFAMGCMQLACQKDLGNYSYTELNEGMVSNLDSLYSIKVGDVLRIVPKITYSKDQVGDTANYAYSWLEIGPDDGYIRPYALATVVSRSPVFDIRVKGELGLYNYAFRITDKKTGVWKEFLFKILKANDVYEGWLLLSEISGGQSRLDMLSYKTVTKDYRFIPDVLTAVKSTFKLKGKPSFIAKQFKDLIIGTSEVAVTLGGDSLQFGPSSDFSYKSEGGTNVAVGVGAKMESGGAHQYLWANGNVYFTQNDMSYYSINKMSVGDVNPFKAAPFVSYRRNWMPSSPLVGAILFNASTSEFLWHPGGSSLNCLKIDNESLFKNKIDKNLLFMKFSSYNNGDETFALLKDKVGDKVYLARFTAAQQRYFEEIINTPIAQAEQFEVSDDFGYIFYSIGGKLYEYDFNGKVNKQMADYGNRRISLLKFQNIDNPFINRNKRYLDITKRLAVCTYEEGKLDNSGTMDLYAVPPINGTLIKEETFSGMGKIVSITYRDR